MLALWWKLASSPDYTQILKLRLWVSTWASRSELTLWSHMGLTDMKLSLAPVDVDGCSVLTFSCSITHNDWYWCLEVLFYFFFFRAKTNALYRFVGPVTVGKNGGTQNLKSKTATEATTTTTFSSRSPCCFSCSKDYALETATAYIGRMAKRKSFIFMWTSSIHLLRAKWVPCSC